jgi:hypothetical protein
MSRGEIMRERRAVCPTAGGTRVSLRGYGPEALRSPAARREDEQGRKEQGQEDRALHDRPDAIRAGDLPGSID